MLLEFGVVWCWPVNTAVLSRSLWGVHLPDPDKSLFGLGFLAVQRDDGGEDVGNLLRGVELARLLAGPGGKLADQVPAVWRSEQSSDLVGCAVAHRF